MTEGNNTHRAWYDGETEDQGAEYYALNSEDAAAEHAEQTAEDKFDVAENGVPDIWVRDLEQNVVARFVVQPLQIWTFQAEQIGEKTFAPPAPTEPVSDVGEAA